jgi:hypothetical protein
MCENGKPVGLVHTEEGRRGPQWAVCDRGDEARAAAGREKERATAGREIPVEAGRLGFSCGASRVKPWAECGAG